MAVKVVSGTCYIFIFLLSTQAFSDLLLRPLENAYPALSENINSDFPQAIVVLGGGTIQGSPEAGKNDTLASDAMKRAVYGYTLFNKFNVPVIFSGGRVFNHYNESEADAAGRLYESLGLPSQWFIAEGESRNTWENAKETAKLTINDESLKQVILVTSAYHMKRSVYCYEKNGIKVIPAPTDYKIQRGRRYDFFSFMPSNAGLNNTWIALHEYFGLLYYKISYK